MFSSASLFLLSLNHRRWHSIDTSSTKSEVRVYDCLRYRRLIKPKGLHIMVEKSIYRQSLRACTRDPSWKSFIIQTKCQNGNDMCIIAFFGTAIDRTSDDSPDWHFKIFFLSDDFKQSLKYPCSCEFPAQGPCSTPHMESWRTRSRMGWMGSMSNTWEEWRMQINRGLSKKLQTQVQNYKRQSTEQAKTQVPK
jgi:hypothetical protein